MSQKNARSEPDDSPKRHTAKTVAEVVAAKMEPETAEEVLEVLRKCDGQLITTRLLDKLPGGRVDWRLSRNLGWTEIKNRAYANSSGQSRTGICLIIARSEQSVPLVADFVEKENPAYFKGRRERNALRNIALADQELLERVAAFFNKVEDWSAQGKELHKVWAVFSAHGEPLSPDRYDLERCCGLREDDKKK